MASRCLLLFLILLCALAVARANTSESVASILSDSTGRIWASSGASIYRSSDTGRTWQVFTPASGRTLFRTRLGTIIAGADRGTYRSTDGLKWVSIDSGLHSRGLGGDGVNGFVQDRSNFIYAATGHGIYRSTDEGLSWLPSGLYDSVHIRLDSSLSSIAFDSNGVFFVGHTDIGAYLSHDGRNWIALDSPMKYVAPTAIGVNSHNLIFAGHGRRIFVSSDDGASWTQKDIGLLSSAINQILIDEFDNVYLATLGGVFVSRDSGNHWGLLGKGLSDTWINAITRFPSGDMAAAGLHGVYFYSHIDSTWREIDHNWGAEGVVGQERQITPFRIFPNPSNSVLHFGGLQPDAKVECCIYDALGREVLQAVINGTLPLTINTLLPGAYRVVCRQNGNISAEKLTVVR